MVAACAYGHMIETHPSHTFLAPLPMLNTIRNIILFFKERISLSTDSVTNPSHTRSKFYTAFVFVTTDLQTIFQTIHKQVHDVTPYQISSAKL